MLGEVHELNTPQRHLEVKGTTKRLASLSMPDSEEGAQDSPDSVLPAHSADGLVKLRISSDCMEVKQLASEQRASSCYVCYSRYLGNQKCCLLPHASCTVRLSARSLRVSTLYR